MNAQQPQRVPQIGVQHLSDQVALILADPLPAREFLTPVRWALDVIGLIRGQENVTDRRSAGEALLLTVGLMTQTDLQFGAAHYDAAGTVRGFDSRLAQTRNALAVVGHLLYSDREDLDELREAWGGRA